MGISIGNGVLKANDLNSLSEYGGGIKKIVNWIERFCNLWTGLNEKEPLEKVNLLPDS